MPMREKLCVCAVCQNNDSFWCIDAIIGGLYHFDKVNRSIRCVLSPKQIYREGYFLVRKILYWNRKIFILPTHLNKEWVVYNIQTEQIDYFHPIPFHFISEETIVIENHAFCIPFFSNEPVLILDLETLQYEKKINIWKEREMPEKIFEIWNAKTVENESYFLIHNSSYLCKISIKDEKIIILEIPEKMSCADFCNNDGWALTVTGKTLYKLDENGACLEKIEMETNQKFIRLIATYRFVFLLPQKGNMILVYDAYLHQFNLINSGIEEISHLLPEKLYFSSYWEYIIEKNKIHFMPCRYPYFIIDLVTLNNEQSDLSHSDIFSKEHYWKYYFWIQNLNPRIFVEETEENLVGFINMIKYIEVKAVEGRPKKSKIWEYMKKNLYEEILKGFC